MTPERGDTADVELLERVPRIGPLIARAALTAPGRPGAGGPLPAHRVEARGLRVDPQALADYVRVCGGSLRNEVPPSYLHVLAFPLQVHLMARRDFPFALAGMVHVANEMTLHRPVDLGEELTVSVAAADVRPHRRGSTVDLLGRVDTPSGTVWQGRSTYLVRGAGADPGVREVEPARTGGALQPWATWSVGTDLGRRYAAVAGDVNPIHLSALAAKAFGFPRAIAHGMWTHARVLSALQGRLPEAYTVTTQFRRPVLLPSRIELRVARAGALTDLAVTGPAGSPDHLVGQVRALPEGP